MHRFSELVRPLRDLANTKGTFNWTPEHNKIFEDLKTKLCEYCLNSYFYINRKTFLFTNAGKRSNNPANKYGGFPAILSQTDENRNFLPTHYASRSISPVENNYSKMEIESTFDGVWTTFLITWKVFITSLVSWTANPTVEPG